MPVLQITGSLIPTTRDTPLDTRTRVLSRVLLPTVENPFIGMHVYILDEKTTVEVKSLDTTNPFRYYIKEVSSIMTSDMMASLEDIKHLFNIN